MVEPKQSSVLVVDTDVLIDYLRDQADAVLFLESSAWAFGRGKSHSHKPKGNCLK